MNTFPTPTATRNPFECLTLIGNVQHWISDLTGQLQTQVMRVRRASGMTVNSASQKDLNGAVHLLEKVQGLLFGTVAPTNEPAPATDQAQAEAEAPDALFVAGLREFESQLLDCQRVVAYARQLLADAASRLDRLEAEQR